MLNLNLGVGNEYSGVRQIITPFTEKAMVRKYFWLIHLLLLTVKRLLTVN
jgi:hypothetical protein